MRKGNGLLVGVTNFVKVYLVSVVAMETVEFQSWNDMSDREFGKYPSCG